MRPVKIFLLWLAILSACGVYAATYLEKREVEVVFDALDFLNAAGETLSEQELIAKIGEPQEIVEWDFSGENGGKYPIRTLSYEGVLYLYQYYQDSLQRIIILEEFPYKYMSDILPMFGLRRDSDTAVTVTEFNYLALNCGVREFRVPAMSKSVLKSIYISYGSVFEW
ncbi:MAG: hypothetical protein LBK98_06815 [Peptococcaceae bacterium]|nr:hypothetical protein [Peptococcaceae bacterium]